MLKRGLCCENGINPKAVYDFIKKCEDDNLGLDSFMLLKDGMVVAEGYHTPYNPKTRHIMYSMSKSITATALGFAIAEGKISLSDSISKFFPEYDKRRRNESITVRHLVTMTAGKMVGMAKNRHKKDWVKIFFDAPAIAKPGKMFMYINDNFYLLSAIISKVYGETLVDFLEPRLFKPLGIEKPVWEQDMFGNASGGWGLYMPLEDQAKIMLCYSQNGVWEGKQVIPADWVREATKYQVPTLEKGQIDVTKGYGYGFWRTSTPNTYRAYGLHGQGGYVFEDKNTVFVINAGISKDELQALAVDEMYEHLWDEPVVEYEDKLKELIASLGDKDDLPATIRNRKLELDYNQKPIKTVSSSFASMLHATVTTVMDEPLGRTDRFILSLDDNNDLFLRWNEGAFTNVVKLGFDNEYVSSPIELAGIKMTAHTKASWDKNVLTVYIRIEETCHVRVLKFEFLEQGVRVHNDSFPDMPTLAVHYVDFSGFPLPAGLEKLLKKYIAPGVLLIGEPTFNSRIKKD